MRFMSVVDRGLFFLNRAYQNNHSYIRKIGSVKSVLGCWKKM